MKISKFFLILGGILIFGIAAFHTVIAFAAERKVDFSPPSIFRIHGKDYTLAH